MIILLVPILIGLVVGGALDLLLGSIDLVFSTAILTERRALGIVGMSIVGAGVALALLMLWDELRPNKRHEDTGAYIRANPFRLRPVTGAGAPANPPNKGSGGSPPPPRRVVVDFKSGQ
jgi:hypothetical protein